MTESCETCQKRRFSGSGCEVLKEAVGGNGSCSFWTDDPNWDHGIEEAVYTYSLMQGSNPYSAKHLWKRRKGGEEES